MKKVYQVFISSTYEDLKDERLAVLNALLSINCLPAGMEHFSAASEEQFEYIKRIIDRTDYYVLIIGGRYGSVDASGVSYTEKEFDYAVKKGVPVLAFIRSNVDDIPAKYAEYDPEKRDRLDKFRKKVMNKRLISLWSQKDELSAKVISSLETAVTQNPRPGMVRTEDIDERALESGQFSALEKNAKNQEMLLANLQNEIEKNRILLENINVKNKIDIRRPNGIKNAFYYFAGRLKRPKEEEYSNRQVTDYKLNGNSFITELMDGCDALSRVREGALIVIEKNIPLTEYLRTGLYVDCIVSNLVLQTLFFDRNLLHDGAAIIRGTRIVAATCYLPLSDNPKLPHALGLRHRAAVGISEVSDAVVLVVSEETGNVSLAHGGKLYHALSKEQLKNGLVKFLSDKYTIEPHRF